MFDGGAGEQCKHFLRPLSDKQQREETMAEVPVKETETLWIKHGLNKFTTTLGKDVVVMGGGSFLSFLETSRTERKQIIYHANSEFRGDGVQCYCAHRSLPCFAFAEMCRNPRILIVSYPSFENIKTFDSDAVSYVALRFSEMEFLVALTGIPDYKIIVWNWKTTEKLYTQESKLEAPEQVLRVSFTSPVQILQATVAERQVLFWDMNLCYKKTLLNRTPVTLPQTSKPPFCHAYGADGDVYAVDSCGNLYSINAETFACGLQLSVGEEGAPPPPENFVPALTWHKGGLAFSTPWEVHFWRRKSPEGWSRIWSFVPKLPLLHLMSFSAKDLLVGVNARIDVMVIKGETQAETVNLRTIGADFDFVCLVQPMGDHVATFGNALRVFTLWNKLTGSLVSELHKPGRRINAVEANPQLPYLATASADGKVAVVSVYEAVRPWLLDEIALTHGPLDGIRFRSQGTQFCVANKDVGEFFLLKVPRKLEVVAHCRIDLKVVDFALLEREFLVLLVVPMSQMCCRSGQTVLVYVLDERSKEFRYADDVVLPCVVTAVLPSPFSSRELFCVPHRSRRVCVVNVDNGKMLGEYVSGHQIKSFCIKSYSDQLLTFGFDGLLVVKEADRKQCVTLYTAHHRMGRGVKAVAVDPYTDCVLSLGGRGTLVCTRIKKLTSMLPARPRCDAILTSPACKVFHGGPEEPRPWPRGEEGPEDSRKVWLSLRQQELVAEEEQQSRKDRFRVQDEFREIQTKLRRLMDENFENVPERQLPVQAFDLDKAARRRKLEDGKAEREKEKQLRLASMKSLARITEVIRKTCWESVEVRAREIHGILTPLAVQSYSLLPENPAFKLCMTWLPEEIKMEHVFRAGDFFEPWVPRTDSALKLHIEKTFDVAALGVTQAIKTKFEEEQTEEKAQADSATQAWRHVWTGTSTHQFVEVDPHHYSQFELTTFLQGKREIQLIQVDIKKLMLWFNREFEEVFGQKEREMASVSERNNRFRHIIAELAFFGFSPGICATQIYDPQWAPQENPETIMTVEDGEIGVPMYLSESRMDLIRKQELEQERLRQLLMADDFKERALLVMMDGVLEKLWEDEIKKDPPKPKCMVEKDPENWTEDDLKAIRTYEEALRFLASERERYRKILETEWYKMILTVKDSVSKFDEKVAKLHLLKLRVESAIGQEILKILRIRKRCFERADMDRKEDLVKASLLRNEKKMEAMAEELAGLLDMLNECRNFYENLQNRDRNLDKNFKREFPDYSPILCEQLYKLSKKRPKLLQKAATHSTVLVDMGKCAVSGTKPEYMPAECIQYLKDIDALDAYSNAPASVSAQSWELACKMRRQKIDAELRIRACAVDLADAEATVAAYQKSVKGMKEQQAQLQNELQALRAEKLSSSLNYSVQLVLKKGLVEIPLTGHLSDFCECALVTKVTLSEVNRSIRKVGQQKIKAMEKAANFRKGIIYKEWEHKKLRMEIEDLKSRLENVEKLQVLKELQAILVARARGFTEEKGFLYLENELAGVQEGFRRAETELFGKMDDLEGKIQKISSQNARLDERIAELNVEVNELDMMRDKDFARKNAQDNARRMKRIRERSALVRRIQDQHNEILVLQTELELLRLKTYPAVKYRIS